jgi:hypothetical protein
VVVGATVVVVAGAVVVVLVRSTEVETFLAVATFECAAWPELLERPAQYAIPATLRTAAKARTMSPARRRPLRVRVKTAWSVSGPSGVAISPCQHFVATTTSEIVHRKKGALVEKPAPAAAG